MSQYLRRQITMRNGRASTRPMKALSGLLDAFWSRKRRDWWHMHRTHHPRRSVWSKHRATRVCSGTDEPAKRPFAFVGCWAAKPGSRRLRVGWRCVVASWPSDHHTARREKTCTSSDHCNALDTWDQPLATQRAFRHDKTGRVFALPTTDACPPPAHPHGHAPW